MRTSCAEIGQTRRQFGGVVCAFCVRNGLKRTRDLFPAATLFDQYFADGLRDIDRIKRRIGFEQNATILFRTVNATPIANVKNRFFRLGFDQFALFFNDDDHIQPIGPFAETVGIKGPSLHDFIRGNAQAFGLGLINTKHGQRMHHIQPIFARSSDTNFCARLADHPLINAIGARKGTCRGNFVVYQTLFLGGGRIDKANV